MRRTRCLILPEENGTKPHRIFRSTSWMKIFPMFAQHFIKLRKDHSGVHAFSSRIKCGECCWYGPKVWHSNSKYRKVIWRCNHKYDVDKTCRTPHLTDEDIQTAYLRAMNKLLETKNEVIANGYAMIPVLLDTVALEAEHNELLQETQVVSDIVQQCIYENVHVALDKPNTRNSTTH